MTDTLRDHAGADAREAADASAEAQALLAQLDESSDATDKMLCRWAERRVLNTRRQALVARETLRRQVLHTLNEGAQR